MLGAMEAQRRIAAYTEMIQAFNANDLGAIPALVHDDLLYTIPGRSFLASATRGVAAHLAVLGRARAETKGTLRFIPTAKAVDGDYLLIWGAISAERNGRRLEGPHSVMYRFEGQRIAEGRTIPIDLYAFDEFWSEP
jgi:ketosteroid isomerase-like protein